MSNKLLQHSLLLFAATQVGSVANLLFQMVMGRALQHDPAEYGVLIAMLTIGHIFGLPIDALRTALAHFSARLVSEGHRADVLSLGRQWTRRVVFFAIPLILIGFLFSSQLASFFKLSDSKPIILTVCILAGMPCLAVVIGVLQGLQAFIWMSVVQHGWALIRLAAGWLLVVLIAPVAIWGLAGQIIGVAVMFIVGVVVVEQIFKGQEHSGIERGSWREYRYFILSMIALAGYAILMNIDVLLVKHYFSPEEAGVYSQAAVIGRTVIFLPMPIAAAMFPKVVSGGAMSSDDRKTLGLGIFFSIGIIAAAVIACFLLPWLPIRILYGIKDPSPEMLHLVKMVVLAMSPLGLTYLLTNFELAQHRFKLIGALGVSSVGYVLSIVLWHDRLLHIVLALGIAATLSTILIVAQLPWKDAKGVDGG